MRGRPFPSEALFNREQSLDFGSPVPNGAPVSTEVIVPLDPALGGPSSAPAYYSPVNGVNGPEIRSFGEVIISTSFCPMHRERTRRDAPFILASMRVFDCSLC